MDRIVSLIVPPLQVLQVQVGRKASAYRAEQPMALFYSSRSGLAGRPPHLL
jgi:hypothetical protein